MHGGVKYLPGRAVVGQVTGSLIVGLNGQVSISLTREILTSIIGYWVKKVGESRDSSPVRVTTDAWFGCCNFSSLCAKRVRSRPAGTLDRPNCLVSRAHTMIIHGTHTTGMGISGGGRPAKWGTWTLRWELAGLEVISREGRTFQDNQHRHES